MTMPSGKLDVIWGSGAMPENDQPVDCDYSDHYRCSWRGCRNHEFLQLELCFEHASSVYLKMDSIYQDQLRMLSEPLSSEELVDNSPKPEGVVYYLMLSARRIKIGTTTDLKQRLNTLRAELQYVVALEVGGRRLERERHLQFADERMGRQEDFMLSPRLHRHIEQLGAPRAELVDWAMRPPAARQQNPPIAA